MSLRQTVMTEITGYAAEGMSTEAMSVKKIIMVVALIAMLAGMWCLRDLLTMPIGKMKKMEVIKPRMVIGSGVVFIAVTAIAYSSRLAEFVIGILL